MNVGSSTSGNVALHGWYLSLVPPLGSLSNPANRAFGTNYLSRSYSVVGAYTHVVDMGNTSLDFFLNDDLTSGESAKLSLHVCDETFTLGNAALNPTTHRYRWANVTLDWSSESTRTLYLSVANTAPTVANAIPDQAATAGTAFNYVFLANTFHDANGDTLTYTATKADGNDLPTWLGFTGSTRTFAGTPQAADVETLAVKVTASDGTASVSDEFNIEVSAADTTAPTLTNAIVTSPGKQIQFQFSENLQLDNLPSPADFTVTVGGNPGTLASVSRGLFLNGFSTRISTTITQGQTVVVTYTDPTTNDDTNAIQDAAGNDVATFTTGVNSVPDVVNNSAVVAGGHHRAHAEQRCCESRRTVRRAPVLRERGHVQSTPSHSRHGHCRRQPPRDHRLRAPTRSRVLGLGCARDPPRRGRRRHLHRPQRRERRQRLPGHLRQRRRFLHDRREQRPHRDQQLHPQ